MILRTLLMRQYMLYKNTLNLYNAFYIFKTTYYFKTKLSINKKLSNICTVLISYKLKNLLQLPQLKLVLIIKNNDECEWDPRMLTNYTICTSILSFCKYWPDDDLFRLKLVASNRNNLHFTFHQDLDDPYGLVGTFNWVRSNTVPVHIMKAYGGSRNMAPFILNSDDVWSDSSTSYAYYSPPPPPPPLPTRKTPAAPIDYEGG